MPIHPSIHPSIADCTGVGVRVCGELGSAMEQLHMLTAARTSSQKTTMKTAITLCLNVVDWQRSVYFILSTRYSLVV